MIKKISILLLCMVWSAGLKAQQIDLHEQDGGFSIDASVNGVGIKTFYTEESWFVSMSSNTYLFLYENGYIADSDVKGMTTLKMPDGSSVKAASFLIRELRFGDRMVIRDTPAFVIRKQTVPMLVGSSTFESFGEVKIESGKLVIGDGQETSIAEDTEDPLEALKAEAQDALESRDLEKADSCLSILKTRDALTMLTEYQYAMVLGALQKDSENIEVSTSWLAENEGQSLMMDYWVLNGLGNSYAHMKQAAEAMSAYEKAIGTYCSLFNTSEKAIRKGDFHDETIGATLYSLGVVCASEGKVARMESCFSLAAKCGNSSAKEFCRQYRIKY